MLSRRRLVELSQLDADLADRRLLADSLAANWGHGSKDRDALARRWRESPKDKAMAAAGRARIAPETFTADIGQRIRQAEQWARENPGRLQPHSSS